MGAVWDGGDSMSMVIGMEEVDACEFSENVPRPTIAPPYPQ